MSRSRFPDPRRTRGDVVAIGDDLAVETLRDAYRHGIFPWPHEGVPLPWFSPRRRTVIVFDELHVGRTLRKAMKRTGLSFRAAQTARNPPPTERPSQSGRGSFAVSAAQDDTWHFTIDHDFAAVIRACAATPRPDQDGTWIDHRIVAAYTRFHEAGDAHSVEVWQGDDLVGGLYGIDAGGLFTGESMFYRASDASKLALLFLIDHLRERGATWLDCQVMTPHMRALGAREIPRAMFLDLLLTAQAAGLALF